MKVAICISGVPRGLYRTDFLKKITDMYDSHVFLYYWQSLNHQNLRTHSFLYRPSDPDFNPEIYAFGNHKLTIDSEVFENKIDAFQKIHDTMPPSVTVKPANLSPYSMCYAIMRANMLREKFEENNNMLFDVVIRCRFETFFYKKDGKYSYFDFSKYNLNKIWKPNLNCDLRYGMNDCFAFSNSKNMSHYSSLYNCLHEISLIEGMHPETIFYHHNKHIGFETTHLVGGAGIEGEGYHLDVEGANYI